MSQDQDQPPKSNKDDMIALLRTPLDPDLDYYDATTAIKAMADHIRGLHKLINVFFENQRAHAAAILDIREKMVEHKSAIEFLAGVEDSEPLIGMKPPAIIMPGGGRTN